MKAKTKSAPIPIGLVQFFGIRRRTQNKSATPHISGSHRSETRGKRIKFAGIGGGGQTLPEITKAYVDPMITAAARQQRVDALLDRCAIAAGIVKPAR